MNKITDRYPVVVKANPKILVQSNAASIHIIEEPLKYIRKTKKEAEKFDEQAKVIPAKTLEKVSRSDFYQMMVWQEFAQRQIPIEKSQSVEKDKKQLTQQEMFKKKYAR